MNIYIRLFRYGKTLCAIRAPLFNLQKALLISSYLFFLVYRRVFPLKPVGYVVGVAEIASYLYSLSISLERAYSVNLYPNKYYDHRYDFVLVAGNKVLAAFVRFFLGPILLGKLVHSADGFLYLWSHRFLISQCDDGEFEFRFIKHFRKKLFLFFVGSDIRSPAVTTKMARLRGDEVEADYYFITRPSTLDPKYESLLARRCRVSESYADLIFTASVDQASYFQRPTNSFIYFYPESGFSRNIEKYSGRYRTRIVHAPSSPLTKGTPLVRAAIVRLQNEGYEFDYIELIGVPNKLVLYELSLAHIVLNEFYALVPGVFGIEAMANYCALLTSADELIERDLPAGSNSAWLVTNSYQVYDHLKSLLDSPSLQAVYAQAGYEWACAHAAQSVSGAKLASIIDAI